MEKREPWKKPLVKEVSITEITEGGPTIALACTFTSATLAVGAKKNTRR